MYRISKIGTRPLNNVEKAQGNLLNNNKLQPNSLYKLRGYKILPTSIREPL